ncbi:MAG: hypothetical protein PUB39_06910 [Eubacteriales bacterium]|nr:hypothetical protein [Eubacteriales bacterium]
MIEYKDPSTNALLLKGKIGLEEEGLRTTQDGHMSHAPHQFTGEDHITRDFCENQLEVNTDPFDTPEGAYDQLADVISHIQKRLSSLPEPEFIWPFSNPPYINSADDIPIADFKGDEAQKTEYRKYLSEMYGRYIMTFSGCHFNYSFSEELIEASYKAYTAKPSAASASAKPLTLREYRDKLYLDLAKMTSKYGWLLTTVTAASPVMDSSFLDSHEAGKPVFMGMASVRCSELGYWNYFTPTFDYSSLSNYTASIRKYIDNGYLTQPSELYFPIRLKPLGENTLESLEENGINHIELRTLDLNPLVDFGLDLRDIKFARLLLIWLASDVEESLTDAEQIMVAANFKKAAHMDISEARIMYRSERVRIKEAALDVMDRMIKFYETVFEEGDDRREETLAILDFEAEKLRHPSTRYSLVVKDRFGKDYIGEGLKLAREKQEREINR